MFKGSYPAATGWEKREQNCNNKLLCVFITSNCTKRTACLAQLVKQLTLNPTFKGSYPAAIGWEKIAENGSNKLLSVFTDITTQTDQQW